MKKFLFPVVLAVIAAGILIGLFYDRDKREIRRVLERLCSAVESSGTESPAVAALGVAGADQLFTDEFEVTVDIPQIKRSFPSVEAAKNIMLLKRYFKKISLRFSNVKIDVDNSCAAVRCDAVMETQSSSGMRREMREVTFVFSKDDGKWKIAEIEITSPLEK